MAYNVTGWRSADNSDPSRTATEVDYLFKVQVIDICRLRWVSRNKSQNKEPKVEERCLSARIYANLMLAAELLFVISVSLFFLPFLLTALVILLFFVTAQKNS